MAWITSRIEAMMSVYRRDDFSNPTLAAVQYCTFLEQYSDQVIESVTSPKSGLQTEAKFPPTLAEVKAFCDRSQRSFDRIAKRKFEVSRPSASLCAERPIDRSNRPTMDELRERYSILRRGREAVAPRRPAFRSLAEIAAEAGVSAEAIAAIPHTPHARNLNTESHMADDVHNAAPEFDGSAPLAGQGRRTEPTTAKPVKQSAIGDDV
jgi:hypothetical protein